MAKWFSIRNIYLYAMCLITLVITIFAVVNGTKDLISVIWEGCPIDFIDRTVEECQRQSAINLAGNLIMIVVAVPIFLFHWTRAQKDRKEDIEKD